jgi:hypothetical protein
MRGAWRWTAVGLALAWVAVGCSDDGGDAEAPGTTAASGTFTALSYNVAGLPQGINEDQFPEDHQPLISPLLNEYDVVVLQEDFGFYTDLLRADVDHEFQSEPHPGPEVLNPIDRESAATGDGLNVLSRLRIDEDLERVPWRDCAPAAADCLALKGFALTELEVAAGTTVDLYTLHMEAGSEAEDNQVRGDLLDQLAAYLAEHSDGDAVLIGGDWNLSFGEEPDNGQLRGFMADTDLQDVCDVVDCGADDDVIDRFLFRSGDDVQLNPVDHAFERDVFVNEAGEPLSDHDPLAVTWEWSAA